MIKATEKREINVEETTAENFPPLRKSNNIGVQDESPKGLMKKETHVWTPGSALLKTQMLKTKIRKVAKNHNSFLVSQS